MKTPLTKSDDRLTKLCEAKAPKRLPQRPGVARQVRDAPEALDRLAGDHLGDEVGDRPRQRRAPLPVDLSNHGQTAAIQGNPVWLSTKDRVFPAAEAEWIRDIKVLVNQYSCPAGYVLNPRDLNQGAGGDDVYACVAYGARNGALDYIGLTASSSGSSQTEAKCRSGATLTNMTRVNGDLNSGAGGDFIYFCIRSGYGQFRHLDFDVTSTSPTFRTPCSWDPKHSFYYSTEARGYVVNEGWTWVGDDLNSGVFNSTYIYACVWYTDAKNCVSGYKYFAGCPREFI